MVECVNHNNDSHSLYYIVYHVVYYILFGKSTNNIIIIAITKK